MKKFMLIALLAYLPAHAMEYELKEAVIRGDITRVRALLDQGASVHGRYDGAHFFNGPGDWTLLHFAVREKHDAIVQVLLDNGADVSAQLRYGWTPLHQAASRANVSLVILLLEYGADTTIKTNKGYTPYGVVGSFESDSVCEMIRALMDDFRCKRSKIKGIPMPADESAD